MRAVVLIDNIAHNELAGEWGLAVFIEYNGRKILLDAGGSGTFIANAEKLGIDIADIDCGILSHAHYDHSLGLDDFFAVNKQAKFYLRKGCRENCYHIDTKEKRYNGLPKGCLAKYKDRLIFADGDYEIFSGVTLVPHKTPGLEKIGERACLYVEKDGEFVPDDFSHEQSLVIDTDKGLVIFNSCSHAGADNIIKEIEATYPGKRIYAIVGGFHLFMSTEAEIRDFAGRVKATGIQHVVTGHCTGDKAFAILREELGDVAEQMYSGYELDVR